jgi:hypothetical protein
MHQLWYQDSPKNTMIMDVVLGAQDIMDVVEDGYEEALSK